MRGGWWTGLLILASLASQVGAATVRLFAGGGSGTSGARPTDVHFEKVFGFDQDAAGNSYIVEYTNRLWRTRSDGATEQIAGKDGKAGNSGDGGPAVEARFDRPHSIAVHRPSGDVYIADTENHRIRRLDAKTGTMQAYAGLKEDAKAVGPAEVPLDQARFGGIYCISFSPDFRTLLVTDLDNRQVRAIDLERRTVRLIAGDGRKGAPGEGAVARSASLSDPRAAAMDAAGNVYILERNAHVLRVVDAGGQIRTIVGTGTKGAAGDGGPAAAAQLNGPKHLCVEPDDNVLIADTENHCVRRLIVKSGQIQRVAGSGTKGSAGIDGVAEQVQLSQPHGVFRAPHGDVFICDSMNGRVLRLAE